MTENRQVTLAFWVLTFGTGAQNSVTYVGSLYTFYRDRAGESRQKLILTLNSYMANLSLSILLALTVEQPTWGAYSTKIT